MPSVVEPIAPAPSTSDLPQLDEGDECTEIFGRQTSEALAALRGGVAPAAPSTTAVDAPVPGRSSPSERASASILGVLDESDEVSRELSAQRARAGVDVPEAPATRDLLGEPPATRSGGGPASDDDLDATRADFDLAATRPLPQASAAMAYLPGRPPSEPPSTAGGRAAPEPAGTPPGHGRGGALAGRMTLTPLVPPLPSVSTLAGIGDRPSALPPPRPPALSAAAVVMSGSPASSPPASHGPLPPVTRAGPGSSPPVSSPPGAVVPVMTKAPVVTRAPVGMDFDDATLVKMDDEPPILLQRRKSVPPVTPAAAVDESGERLSSPTGEPGKRGLIGRLLGRVLG